VRHTATGWWLEEAGPVQPEPPLAGDTTADVLVVGGGYLGLWTAWHLRALEPGIDVVVVDAGRCGHGPSGRNGGFVSTLWGDLPTLRERFGDERALAVGHASAASVRAIGPGARRTTSTRGSRPARSSRSRPRRRRTARGGRSSMRVRRSASPTRRAS
jgi:glycine/D-amino acid oxidase-like deaminating enzyme